MIYLENNNGKIDRTVYHKIGITDHAVDRFLQRHKNNYILPPSRVDIINYLKNRCNMLLNNEIINVELIEVVKKGKKSKKNRDSRVTDSVCIMDLETHLIYIINIETDDFKLVTIRNDTCNYKRRKNHLLNKTFKNDSWILITTTKCLQEVASISKNIKKYPDLVIVSTNDNITKNQNIYLQFLIKNCKSVIIKELDLIMFDQIKKSYINATVTTHGLYNLPDYTNYENYNFYSNIPSQDEDYKKTLDDIILKTWNNDTSIVSSKIYETHTKHEITIFKKKTSYNDLNDKYTISLYELESKNHTIFTWSKFLNERFKEVNE